MNRIIRCIRRVIPIFALCSVVACSGVTTQIAARSTGTIWPTHGWQTAKPADQNMDAGLLQKMQAEIKAKKIPLYSLLIIRNGYIVSETYYGNNKKDTLYPLYSVTKSFVSTLAGIAADQGKLGSLDQKVVNLLNQRTFANADPRKDAMTLENLLTMTSGLDWKENDDAYRQMYVSTDWVARVMDYPMAAAPGETFLYCSGCSHVISAIIQQRVGGDAQAFAKQYLFAPLGITNYRWEADARGIPIGGWGLNLTPRDMAKLGYLYLHAGMWEDKQVVSSSWVQAATSKHTATDGNLGYGYQWWTYPTHDAYAALGRYGQTIFVAPKQNIIVVTTAQIEEGHDEIFKLIDNFILPAAQ